MTAVRRYEASMYNSNRWDGFELRRGDSEQMEVLAHQAQAHLSADNEALRPMADLYLAIANQLRGHIAEAENSLEAAVADQHTAAGRYLAVNIACDLGRVRQSQGDLDGALRAYQQAREISTEAGPPLPLAGMVYLGMADVFYERDDLDAAARHASDGIALCRQLGERPRLAAGLARLAWIQQARGDRAGALEAMTEAQQLAPVLSAAGLVSPVPAQRALLQLALGDVAAAADWAHQYGLSAGDEPDYGTEPEHLVLARVLLAQGRPDAAAALLERWLAAAFEAGRTASIIQIDTLMALALAASGDQPSALRTLATALELACPRGYVRVFADEGAPMAALLGQVAESQRAGQPEASIVPADYLSRILAAFDPGPTGAGKAAGTRTLAAGLTELLTERELEVLRLLAAGWSNQRIARDLTVALDTTKKHVSHILAKLDAASRTEAAARARDLGLIP